jgi:hypothetical protein
MKKAPLKNWKKFYKPSEKLIWNLGVSAFCGTPIFLWPPIEGFALKTRYDLVDEIAPIGYTPVSWGGDNIQIYSPHSEQQTEMKP